MANEDKSNSIAKTTQSQLFDIIETTIEALRVKVVEGELVLGSGSIVGFSTETNQDLMLGQNGSTFINDTNSHAGNYIGVHLIEDTVFSTLTDSTRDGNTLEGEQFYKGMVITGDITSIQLTSGKIIAYKR